MSCIKTNRLTIMTVLRSGMRAGLTVTLTIHLIDEFVKSQNQDDKIPALRLFKIKAIVILSWMASLLETLEISPVIFRLDTGPASGNG